LLIYDYSLTFVDEVERFWPCGGWDPSYVSILFLLNRYLTIAGHVPVMWEYFWRITREDIRERVSESLYYFYHQFLVIIIQCIVALMMTIRIYALYERRTWVVVLFVTLSCLAVGTSIWAIINGERNAESPVMVIPYGCGATLASDESYTTISPRALPAAWAWELVFDTLIFGMTLYKTLTLPRTSGISLLMMLIRDGMKPSLFLWPFSRGCVTMFINLISSLMISRLMLNLRDPKLRLRGGGGGVGGESEWTTTSGIYRGNTWRDGHGIITTVGVD
ncbi:hypothetical protein P691DRAFT_825383, partial [Macrolepiota fuliginosa MF-IS2]